jgi:4-hydroxy-2-oxoheptanedioate aldolase
MARLRTSELQATLRTLLRSGGSVGTFIGIPASIPYELASIAGFDWVISDLEHGENEFMHLAQGVVSFGGPVVARVSSLALDNISRSLDRGAAGIMLPRISSESELNQSLAALDYPPKGVRGVASYNRSAGWGNDSSALIGASPVAIVQIETKWAVENIGAIASNQRIDALFIGPLDLSFSLGVPRDFESRIFKDSVAAVVKSAMENNLPIGILANNHDQAKQYLEAGFSFIALGSDSTMLLAKFQEELSQIRGNLG